MGILSTFASYYYKPDGLAFPCWEPTLTHLTPEKCPEGAIDLNKAVRHEDFQLPSDVDHKLDTLITQDIYDELFENKPNYTFLEERGFVFLKKKEGRRIFYHEDLPDYLIKIDIRERRNLSLGATRDPSTAEPISQMNLLRPVGRQYLAEKLKEMPKRDQKHFELPKKYYYETPHAPKRSKINRKYFVISEKKNVFSGHESLKIIKSATPHQQRAIAELIIDFIKTTKIHDWHNSNLVLSKDFRGYRFVLIDTEPIGIKMDASDNESAHLFVPEEQVLLGLIVFRDRCCIDKGLTLMAEVINNAIIDYQKEHPEIEVKKNFYYPPCELKITHCKRLEVIGKIFLSVIIPLIPLILFIMAICETQCCLPKEKPHPWARFETVYQY